MVTNDQEKLSSYLQFVA